MPTTTLIGLAIPFLGTVLGSAMIFLVKDKVSEKIQKFLLGFASGVMLAASVWSLIIPAMEMAEENGGNVLLPVAGGLLFGMLFLLGLDTLTPHLHLNHENPEGVHSHLKKRTMMLLAVTLHNIPEGMAVGVVLAGTMGAGHEIAIGSALALSIGIALQNFPEGAIISLPLKGTGISTWKAFLYGGLSGVVEPLGGLLTIYLTSFFVPWLPACLAFAAGAMIYVVVEELIPEAQEGAHSNWPTVSLFLGFVLMMVLDVALG